MLRLYDSCIICDSKNVFGLKNFLVANVVKDVLKESYSDLADGCSLSYFWRFANNIQLIANVGRYQ